MRRIKEVLVINTITVPSYFNAGHHLPIFQVAQYLREHNDDIGVTCRDIGVLNYTWKDFSSLVFQGQFDLICIMIDFDTADSLERMLYYLKSLSKDSKVLLFGRMCKNNPDIFMITNVDAIAFEGDYETSVDSYIDYYNGTIDQPYGCIYRKDEKWEKSGESRILSPKDWAFPNLSEIPYDDYSKLYLNDSNKFCGIPNKKELVVNVSRGCPINCEFCDVAKMQGTIDRRVSPKELHDYIINNFTKYGYEYELKRSKQLAKININEKEEEDAIIEEEYDRLDEEEKAKKDAKSLFPKIKNDTSYKMNHIVELCNRFNIEVNCFVMIGIPDTSYKEVVNTINVLEKMNVRIRPTVYTRYNMIEEERDLSHVYKYNRQILDTELYTTAQTKEVYTILHGQRLKNTELDKKI